MEKWDWNKKLSFENVMTHWSVIQRNSIKHFNENTKFFVKKWDYDQKWAFWNWMAPVSVICRNLRLVVVNSEILYSPPSFHELPKVAMLALVTVAPWEVLKSLVLSPSFRPQSPHIFPFRSALMETKTDSRPSHRTYNKNNITILVMRIQRSGWLWPILDYVNLLQKKNYVHE